MKAIARTPAVWLLGFLLTTLLGGCFKDHCTQTYTYFTPVYRTTEEVRANIRSNAARAIENPGKIYIMGSYIFLNELDKGLHVIDNSNPRAPKNVAFIDIPGNLDIAAKGNTLYADLYTDMVTLDISNPANVVVKKIIDDAFPFRRYGFGFAADQDKIIVDWQRHDTIVSIDCNTGGWIGWNGCVNCMAFDRINSLNLAHPALHLVWADPWQGLPLLTIHCTQ